MNVSHLSDWIGREKVEEDVVANRDVQRLAAVLGRSRVPNERESLPPCWHWTLFQPLLPGKDLGADGHPKLGEFLPPVPLPRRMFTGIEVDVRQPLLVGDNIRRRSVIERITPKQGKSGPLVFVTLSHSLESNSGGSIVEKHAFVFRGEGLKGPKEPERTEPESPRPVSWRQEIVADPVVVFRFVAASFNAHRIHYDYKYATEIEHYPERIVPGRLAALLLLEALWQKLPRPVIRFSFQAIRPIWVGETLILTGTFADSNVTDLHVATDSAANSMQARAVFAPNSNGPAYRF